MTRIDELRALLEKDPDDHKARRKLVAELALAETVSITPPPLDPWVVDSTTHTAELDDKRVKRKRKARKNEPSDT